MCALPIYCGKRNNLLPFDSCCVSDAGNTDNSLPFVVSTDHLVLTKLIALDLNQNKDLLSTEFVSVEEEEKDKSPRVLSTVNQKLKVLPN